MSCILPIQVPFIGFSSVGSHQHKMNLVWTLLLLAAATGSVNSQACESYQGIEQRIHETFASECQSQFTALQLPHLVNSGLIPTILNPSITKIANLSIYATNVLHVNIRQGNDGLYADIVVILQSRFTDCPQLNKAVLPVYYRFTNFEIHVEISIRAEFTVPNGSPHYHFNHNFTTIKISAAGQNRNAILGQALVAEVSQILKQTVFSVVDKVAQTLNAASSALTDIFYIGQSSCHYTFQSGAQYAGQISYGISLVDDNLNEYASYGYDEYATLQNGEFNLVVFSEIILIRLISLAIGDLEIQQSLDTLTLGLEPVLIGDVFLDLSINSPPQCVISSGGVHIILLVDIAIHVSNTAVFQAQVYLNIDAQVAIKGLSLGLSIDAGISVDTNFQVIYVAPGCGCQDIILQNLFAIVDSSLGNLQVDLNLGLESLTPIPAIGGYPGYGRSCVPHPGYIRCSEY